MSQDPLKEELIKIAGALQPHGIELIVGGGYGLLLRTEHLRDTGPKMRFDEALIARATEDLDLFLSVEIITDAGKMETIRDSLKSLGYKPKVEFFQFEKNINIGGDELFVKVDLLAPRPILEEHLKLVKIGIPRIRPRAAKEIHAYLTEEAVTLDEHRMSIVLSGAGGVQTVFLPHPFTYLILKLFALRDHLEKEDNSKAPEHATDVYRTVGMMTESEWETAVELSRQYSKNLVLKVVAEIVSCLFSSLDSPGPIEIYKLNGRNAAIEVNVQRVMDDLEHLFLTDKVEREH